jgi:hypothetical protein
MVLFFLIFLTGFVNAFHSNKFQKSFNIILITNLHTFLSTPTYPTSFYQKRKSFKQKRDINVQRTKACKMMMPPSELYSLHFPVAKLFYC